MLALIDGDIFRYRCGFAAERNYYLVELTNANSHKEWKEFNYKKEADDYGKRTTQGVDASYTIWSRKVVQPLENCLQIVKGSLEGVLNDIKATKYRIFLSGPDNFRNEIAVTKEYKGNRTDVKPVYYKEIAEYVIANWSAEVTDKIEADDAIGIAALEAKQAGVEYVVVSNDKDLDQIPGKHYDWVKKEFYTVSPKEAKTNFFIQLLTGDATDNIPGISGVGPVTARKILEGCKSPEEMVVECIKRYIGETHGEWEDYFFEQANLVYIRKHKGEQDWRDTKEGQFAWSKSSKSAVHNTRSPNSSCLG
jgi:hypothetical protein